jgi:hypothetical protein
MKSLAELNIIRQNAREAMAPRSGSRKVVVGMATCGVAAGARIAYVKMDPPKARRVVAEHLVNGQICQDLTIGAAEAAAKT